MIGTMSASADSLDGFNYEVGHLCGHMILEVPWRVLGGVVRLFADPQ